MAQDLAARACCWATARAAMQNADLADLRMEPHGNKLKPAFSPKTLSYRAVLPNGACRRAVLGQC